MCPAPARDPAVHPQPHSRCSTRISACSTGRASENSCPQNSLLGRARGPALSDAQSIRESVSPVDSPPERACRTSPGIALPHAALPLLPRSRSEEHTSELQSRGHLVCRLLLEKKKNTQTDADART